MWSFLGSVLGTKTSPTVIEEEKPLVEFESISEAEDGWEDVTQVPKRVTFKDDKEEFVVIYQEKKSYPKEGRVDKFEKIDLVTRSVSKDIVEIDFETTSKELKTTLDPFAPIKVVFKDQLVDVTSLLTSPHQFLTDHEHNSVELRNATLHTLTEVLRKLTGVNFSAYYSATGFDFRSQPIHIADERKHFSFMDSFLVMEPTAVQFKRKALGNGFYQYSIDKLNPQTMCETIQRQEIFAAQDPNRLDKTQIQFKLLKKWAELNKESKSGLSGLIISEPSATVPYPHLRTRFADKATSKAEADELKALEKKFNEAILKRKKNQFSLIESHVKLCLKMARKQKDSSFPEVSDAEINAYLLDLQVILDVSLTFDEVRKSILDDAQIVFNLYSDLKTAFPHESEKTILTSLNKKTFNRKHGVFAVKQKVQAAYEWKAQADGEQRAATISPDDLVQNIIEISDPKLFAEILAEIEPRLAKQKLSDEVIATVPVYNQAKLIHDTVLSEPNKTYPLKSATDLKKSIADAQIHLVKQRLNIALSEGKSTALTSDSKTYQALLAQKAIPEGSKIRTEDIENGKELIEAAVDYVMTIFDELGESKAIQHQQLELLAACQVLFNRCFPDFDKNVIEKVLKHFDLEAPNLTHYSVKFSDHTPAPAITAPKDEVKQTPIEDADLKELVEKLIQFKNAWKHVQGAHVPEHLINNIIKNIHANSSLFLAKSAICFSLKCVESVSDRFGCNDQLADILRSTLAKIKVEIPTPEIIQPVREQISRPAMFSRRREDVRPQESVTVPHVTERKRMPEQTVTAPIELPQRLLAAPKNEPILYNIEFLAELKAALAKAGEDTALFMDQDLTLLCQHTGSNSFAQYVTDRYLDAGKYDQVLSHFAELKAILAGMPNSDKGIVSFNENIVRCGKVADAYGINKARAFAFPTMFLETAKAETELKSLEEVTGLTFQQIRLIKRKYESRELQPKVDAAEALGRFMRPDLYQNEAKDDESKNKLDKNIHLALQLIASNLERHRSNKNFIKEMVFVDDEKHNCEKAIADLNKLLTELSEMKELENIPGIKTLKDIKLHCIQPKLTPRQDPSKQPGMFRTKYNFTRNYLATTDESTAKPALV